MHRLTCIAPGLWGDWGGWGLSRVPYWCPTCRWLQVWPAGDTGWLMPHKEPPVRGLVGRCSAWAARRMTLLG